MLYCSLVHKYVLFHQEEINYVLLRHSQCEAQISRLHSVSLHQAKEIYSPATFRRITSHVLFLPSLQISRRGIIEHVMDDDNNKTFLSSILCDD